MFSSTYTSNAFQTFPSSSSSSSYPPLQFYIDPENAFASNTSTNTNTNILHDPSSLGVVPFVPSTQAPFPEPVINLMVADYASLIQRDNANGNGAAQYGGGVSNFLTKKPAAKKDRHSKIFTSQGLRDRRVRLSSEIARKFFDLQDMLEYDKPSNTLEWLFTKSDNAIKELARSKHSCSGDAKCFCFSPELQRVGVDSNDKTFVGAGAANKERKMKWVEKELDVGVQVQAKKESREKARARARVRSSSKMCSTTGSLRVKDMEERIPATADPRILHQFMPPIHPHTHLMVMGSEAPRDNGFEEAIKEESGVLKRDLKPSLIEIPVGISFNNNDYDPYNSCPNSPQTWDINEAISGRSSFCAIASMNLSAELQIFGKSWEECTNQRRH